MNTNKSLEVVKTIFAALLCDVKDAHGVVFDTRSFNLTLKKVESRLSAEGIGFLTKTLPRLGKALDRALVEGRMTRTLFNGTLGKPEGCAQFAVKRGTELPMLFGELFIRIFKPDGSILPQPCVTSVKVLRQLLFAFYKYKLPYTDAQEQHVLSKFERTEKEDLSTLGIRLHEMQASLESTTRIRTSSSKASDPIQVVHAAKGLLAELFAMFDPLNIHPRHGPGVVATKQLPWDKYRWTNVSEKITVKYPFDAYFCASNGHVCDSFDTFRSVGGKDLPARVLLVPKDSRGPRLISCEPVDKQWVQQGLGRAIVELVESHYLTKGIVNFTEQEHNRTVALLASRDGKYSTIDLNEASDRVHLALVRLLFPEHVYTYLEACRSASTELPDGSVLELNKYAPMGSALCFPVLALTVWALLTAAAPNAHVREHMLVYGDDVIVQTAFAVDAMNILEEFGLKINRSKSCTSGLFRESCGLDAFRGVEVTPVRFRTCWSDSPSPEVYESWLAYANSFFDRRYYRTYNLIVGYLLAVYGKMIPSEDMHLSIPSLRQLPEADKPRRQRTNKRLQKREWYVLDLVAKPVNKCIEGWSMLLRYFAEATVDCPLDAAGSSDYGYTPSYEGVQPLSVRSYTKRGTSMLVSCWRG